MCLDMAQGDLNLWIRGFFIDQFQQQFKKGPLPSSIRMKIVL